MPGTAWGKFFWNDWRGDPALRVCSLAAQGLWMQMLCVAAESDPEGYVTIGSRPVGATDLARLTGASEAEVTCLMEELDRNGVFSRDRHGRIYCRRMVRDAKKAQIARKNGKKGGNPSLCKKRQNSPSDKGSDMSEVKPQKPDARSQSIDILEAAISSSAPERDCGPDFVGDVLSVPGGIVDRWSELFSAHPDVRADLATIDATLAVSCLGKTQAELQRRAMGMLRKRHEDELRAERGRSQRVENGDGLWGGRVADWRSCGFWEPSWGPPPDMPGFLGPDSLSAAPPRAVRRGGAA